MIVLSRRQNESIVIDNDITLTIVEIRGDKVRLGIVAPKEYSVHRLEVYEAIHSRPRPEPPGPEEAGFLKAIAANPRDRMARLVYADWLQEHGDPRGEYLHLQCRLAELSPEDERRQALAEQAQALWRQHGATWQATLHWSAARLLSAPVLRGR